MAVNKMNADLHYFVHKVENKKYPPVILIHGAGGFHLSWPPGIRRIPDRNIFALDLNGHGKSKGNGRVSINEHANDVLQFMDALNLKSAVFAGHSMGGAVALSIAIQQPSCVNGLILVGTGAKLGVSPALLEASSRVETFPAAVEMVIENSFSHYADSRIKELTKQQMLRTNPHTLHADFLACHSFNVLDSISYISTPTLVVCGMEDQMTPVKFSKTLHDRIPNSKMELIPNAGHMLMLEKPRQMLQLVADFLKSTE